MVSHNITQISAIREETLSQCLLRQRHGPSRHFCVKCTFFTLLPLSPSPWPSPCPKLTQASLAILVHPHTLLPRLPASPWASLHPPLPTPLLTLESTWATSALPMQQCLVHPRALLPVAPLHPTHFKIDMGRLSTALCSSASLTLTRSSLVSRLPLPTALPHPTHFKIDMGRLSTALCSNASFTLTHSCHVSKVASSKGVPRSDPTAPARITGEGLHSPNTSVRKVAEGRGMMRRVSRLEGCEASAKANC